MVDVYSMTPQEEAPHSMTAQEYAKVRAILERIAGLRRAMTATAVIGVLASILAWLFVTSFELLTLNASAFGLGLEYGIVAFVPFIAIIGYFSYRVNRHIDRLSRGKYEPPMMIE
jgi:hypothetical protein